MKSLFKLTSEFERIEQLFLELESNEDLEKNQELQSIISELVKSKVDQCAEYDLSLTDFLIAIKSRIESYARLYKTIEKRQARYLDYIKLSIENTGTSAIQGNFYTATIKTTKSVEVNQKEFDKIKNDIEFEARGVVRRKIELEPNKDKIKEILKTEKLNFAQIKETKRANFKMGKA